MLRSLASRDQARIHGRIVEVLFHDGGALFDDPFHAVAVLPPNLLAQSFEYLLDPLDVAARLLQMRLERITENRRCRRLCQPRQGLDQLLFRVVHVAQLVQKSVMQRTGLGHESDSSSLFMATGLRSSGPFLRNLPASLPKPPLRSCGRVRSEAPRHFPPCLAPPWPPTSRTITPLAAALPGSPSTSRSGSRTGSASGGDRQGLPETTS